MFAIKEKITLSFVFLFALHFCFSTVNAQNKDKEVAKLISQAQAHMDIEEFEKALELFQQAYKLKPKDPEIAYRIGVIQHELKHEVKALPYLLEAKQGGATEKDLDYYLGISYHFNHQFDKAIQVLTAYKATLKPKEAAKAEEVSNIISYCKNGIELVKNPVKVKIKNLGKGVNSKYDDYMPAVSADETVLIFTSRRDNTTGGKKAEDGKFFEDIYISVKSDTVWTTAVQLGNGINTPTHDAVASISPDGQKLFIYKVDNGGDLFSSDLKGSIWSEPKNLGTNINSQYWEPSVTITSDEKVLFFTSNKKGGYGGTDIYMSKRQNNGEWGAPILLGPKINTRYDEDGPFIHADGKTLYFSSKGHKSMGGFDIFSCTINTETGEVLTEPVNIGYPINTADDDVFFAWSADNKRAYFSSEREGGYGEKDIYVLERDEADASLVVFKGKISSCKDKKPVAATIVVTDLETQKPLGVYNSNSSSGKYTVILPAGKNYGIAVEAPGFLFYSKNIDVPFLNTYLEIKDSICLEAIEVGKKIVLRNVFFDVDKATLRKESVDELERLLEILTKNPTIKIQIGGHTDSDGNDDHNMKLSHNRAKAVVEYLVKKGIPEARLSFKGYGETKPIAPNDTPENKQLNRRTEIEILQ
ncbi:MAG: OmpA family protein [Cytophagaceae bacterium]